MEAYLDIAGIISAAYGDREKPQSNYLVITADRDGIPEERYFGIEPLDEIREYLNQVKITHIENSIPGSFVISDKLWNIKGEGVAMFGREVSLFCYNLDSGELRDLLELVKNSSSDYSIEFAGKKIRGNN